MQDYLFLVGFGLVIFGVIVAGMAIKKSQKKEAIENERLAKNAKKRLAATQSLKRINWKPQFSIDGGVIDEDHKTLIRLINEFNAGIASFITADKMIPNLKALTEYTQEHFKREEELLAKTDFPLLDDHKKKHQAVIQQFNGLKLKALKTTEDTITDVAVEISKFLQGWLSGHVIESDLPFRSYMDAAREDTKDSTKNAGDAAENAAPPPT
jgi:hemerythrin